MYSTISLSAARLTSFHFRSLSGSDRKSKRTQHCRSFWMKSFSCSAGATSEETEGGKVRWVKVGRVQGPGTERELSAHRGLTAVMKQGRLSVQENGAMFKEWGVTRERRGRHNWQLKQHWGSKRVMKTGKWVMKTKSALRERLRWWQPREQSRDKKRQDGEGEDDEGFGKWVNGHGLASWHTNWGIKKKKFLFQSVILFFSTVVWGLPDFHQSTQEHSLWTNYLGQSQVNTSHLTTQRGNLNFSYSKFLPAHVAQ